MPIVIIIIIIIITIIIIIIIIIIVIACPPFLTLAYTSDFANTDPIPTNGPCSASLTYINIYTVADVAQRLTYSNTTSVVL